MKKSTNDVELRQILYIQVYDELYKRIMNNEFPEGSLLPPETKLAELLHVSRVTLRQALSLLHEDGLIKSVRGRGNIVTRPVQNAPDGLEKISHPIYRCCEQEPDHIDFDSHLELPTDYMKTFFQHKSTAVMVAERWYKHEDELLAYSISFIPVESAERLQVDLSNRNALLELLEKNAYTSAVSATIDVKLADTSRFITNRYTLEEDRPAILLSENLYFGEKYPYIYNKHYLITAAYSIHINGSR